MPRAVRQDKTHFSQIFILVGISYTIHGRHPKSFIHDSTTVFIRIFCIRAQFCVPKILYGFVKSKYLFKTKSRKYDKVLLQQTSQTVTDCGEMLT